MRSGARPRAHHPCASVGLAAALLASSCALENPVEPRALDPAFFRCRVEPVLARSCAFLACHGDPMRPFRMFAPNRLRLGVAEAERALALTPSEEDANFRAALRFAGVEDGYDEPLLVEKPLDRALGGAYHGAVADYGPDDVFVDLADPDLATLRAWIDGAREEPSCTP
jgi:hypothetical protein